jgi:NSS family neurotransmitter:Na+ symporter
MSAIEACVGACGAPAEGSARPHWSSRLTFVLAAAGSAVGLGSIWKFPYITGANGGGWFVAIYLACIALVALPIMIAELAIGRLTQRSTVGAIRALAGRSRAWRAVGWLAVAAAFLILSYYFVVAGWTLHYVALAVSGRLLETGSAADLRATFAELHANAGLSVLWQLVFVGLTAAIAAAGVRAGIERCCRVLMPFLLAILVALTVQAASGPGFARGLDYVFGWRAAELTTTGALEALGHSFFTLSLGMGAMLTYGSYLGRTDDAVATSIAVAGLDTAVSLLACMSIFPILFAAGLAADAGPGLVFVSIPVALAELPAGAVWAALFFALLAVAALASTVGVFEVLVAHLCDEQGMRRARACLVAAAAVLLAGIPAALSGGTQLFGATFASLTTRWFGTGRNWFDFVDHAASNWLLPLAGLGVALLVAWRIGEPARELAFKSGSRFGRLYWAWVWLLRWFVPPAVIAVFLDAIGVI